MAFGNQLDPSNRDAGVVIGNWPVKGMYMPDSIATFEKDGKTYLLTANEGDDREAEDGGNENAGDPIGEPGNLRILHFGLFGKLFARA